MIYYDLETENFMVNGVDITDKIPEKTRLRILNVITGDVERGGNN